MSAESLIFLAIFFLLPLIERLMERNRRKRAPAPPPENGDPLDPMQPAPRQRRVEPPTPSRPVPPPPPIPMETRRPEPEPGPVPSRPKQPAREPRPMPRPSTAMTPAEVLRSTRVRERAVAQRAETAAANAVARVRSRQAQAIGRILRHPPSLRRAMVVASVLGPCKALEPEPGPRS